HGVSARPANTPSTTPPFQPAPALRPHEHQPTRTFVLILEPARCRLKTSRQLLRLSAGPRSGRSVRNASGHLGSRNDAVWSRRVAGRLSVPHSRKPPSG